MPAKHHLSSIYTTIYRQAGGGRHWIQTRRPFTCRKLEDNGWLSCCISRSLSVAVASKSVPSKSRNWVTHNNSFMNLTLHWSICDCCATATNVLDTSTITIYALEAPFREMSHRLSFGPTFSLIGRTINHPIWVIVEWLGRRCLPHNLVFCYFAR